MTAFEFTFSLFGLLLGFSLVEVLGGLARTMEARLRPAQAGKSRFRSGWLTPLLGLFVMLDVVSFWAAAWVVRDQLIVSGPIFLGGLFFAGSYYLAAHLVFPAEPGAGPDLDDHYFRVRRLVLGAMLGLLAIQLAYFLTIPALAASFRDPRLLASIAVFVILLVAGMVVRTKRASLIVLTALILRYVYEYLA